MKTILNKFYLAITILVLLTCSVYAGEVERVVRLKGYWKFSIGDNMEWKEPGYNDSDWENVRTPSSWENEGFHGYNGFAWYRKTFTIDSDYEHANLYLQLGYIDDVDEVYVNGKFIGTSGEFPPDFFTAYNTYRKYLIPHDYLNFDGENVIAVRVYDQMLEGGIVHGEIGIYSYGLTLPVDLNLTGRWKFKTGDNYEWKDIDVDVSEWKDILVPGHWEAQGFRDYDGFAWYRKVVEVPEYLEDEKLVLMLGKIDDIDEVFVNGKKVGSTGKMDDDPFFISFDQEFSQFRGYYLKKNSLNYGADNVIAVRVYDGYRDGGIYEGPIGLVTQEEYANYWKKKKRKTNILELLFD